MVDPEDISITELYRLVGTGPLGPRPRHSLCDAMARFQPHSVCKNRLFRVSCGTKGEN